MRPLLVSAVVLMCCGTAFANESADAPAAAAQTATPTLPTHPHHRHHASHAARLRGEEAKVISAQDTDSQIGQIPAGLLGPPGNRIPETGPEPPKTKETETPAKANTVDCSGANAANNPAACGTAAQQTRGK